MEVIYNNNPIKNNEFLQVIETQNKPQIKLDLDTENKYLLIMYDPDAVLGTYIHWILSNIINNDASNGVNLIEYKGPAPPPKSGRHRYIFELYNQKKENISINETERIIPIESLRIRLGLGEPIYKIQFISQNKNGGKKRTTNKIRKFNKVISKNNKKKTKKLIKTNKFRKQIK